MPEFSEYNFDRFEGKALDEELDEEEGLDEISSEDLANDFRSSISGISAKLPEDFKHSLEIITDNIEFYYNLKDDETWQEEVIEPLNELLDNLLNTSRDEIEDSEELATALAEIQKESEKLKKKKAH